MISILRNYSIRTRMMGAIAMVLCLLTLVGGVGQWGLKQVTASSEYFVKDTHGSLENLGDLRYALGNLRRYEKDMLLNATDSAKVTDYKGKWSAAADDARTQLKALVGTSKGDAAASAARLQPLLAAYFDKASAAFKQLNGTPDGAIQAIAGINAARQQVHAFEAEIQVLAKALQAEKVAHLAEEARTVKLAYSLFGAAVLLAVVLVVPLTLANMVSICNPINEARRLAERIATGDLSQAINSQGADEAASLLKALGLMQDSLHGIVGQVRQSAESIQVASAEVASGNLDLSQRTEQAASHLQQTAGSVQQLTGSVRHSADAAAQANQLAASASSVARRGGDVVGQVVSTMDEINQSSKRIADIIGTIDGIAFQTNILALNAAVEAARAGEQGRGFAVVASEVRSLAQRSAEAAREIKALIGTSVDKVETGARLVQDAGATMNEIVASVQRVTDVIGEITAAAAEQSGGIGQVNSAVTSLDQMTQQNAALVEESAAAAESLKDQAQRLAGVVARFDLGAGGSPAAGFKPMAARPLAPLTASARPAPRPATPAVAAPRPAHKAATASAATAPAAARRAEAPAAVAQANSGSSDWESF